MGDDASVSYILCEEVAPRIDQRPVVFVESRRSVVQFMTAIFF